ncbi:MAG: P1 family peptidase [Acidimicrobiaceae bacterium]|nr:P1 family peptidase [Acidimicrobiaceae bacterium]
MPVELRIPGVDIGHWTDPVARTGCTVIVLPPGTVASGEVRGGAPATRDFALLAPERLVECVDAVVLAGGSAFGLAAADGVMEVLESEGRGFATAHGPVPIVVAMALYDLGVGDPAVRPDAAAGRHAATNRATSADTGPVGAGAGATVSKWLGAENAEPGGLGIATAQRDELAVSAVVALNAAGSPPPDAHRTFEQVADGSFQQWKDRSSPFTNTTLCAVVTNAALSKTDCFWVAQGGHDGLAREVVPAHTRSDGDAVVAAATGGVPADTDDVRLLAVAAVAKAVRSAVGTIEG